MPFKPCPEAIKAARALVEWGGYDYDKEAEEAAELERKEREAADGVACESVVLPTPTPGHAPDQDV